MRLDVVKCYNLHELEDNNKYNFSIENGGFCLWTRKK